MHHRVVVECENEKCDTVEVWYATRLEPQWLLVEQDYYRRTGFLFNTHLYRLNWSLRDNKLFCSNCLG
jgi:hypothetical protein